MMEGGEMILIYLRMFIDWPVGTVSAFLIYLGFIFISYRILLFFSGRSWEILDLRQDFIEDDF